MSETAAPQQRRAQQLLRFIGVGIANTAIDVGLLFLFLHLGVPLVWANMLSTGIALVFSFFVNRSFTFASSGNKLTQGVLFLAVTLTGLWVLQPLVMVGVIHLAGGIVMEPWLTLGAKGCATVVSMAWNYVLYSRVVFRRSAN